ncbi:MAG: GerMN domain-containing protein [Parcubacteria group bacterium]|nr:GerMN domain-containing protein [Parcubacteria group bacterium]
MKAANLLLVIVILFLVAFGIYTVVTKAPSQGPASTNVPTPTATATSQTNIQVFSPTPSQQVGLPLVVTGQARVFENTFSIRLKDQDGTELVEVVAMANSPDIGQFGPFSVSINYPAPQGTTGTLEAFQYSAQDGSEIDKVIVPVKFADIASDMVNVYFSREGDSLENECNAIHAVARRIPKTEAVARAALEELLKGTTVTDAKTGYISNINSGVNLQSITIENGVAKVDLDDALEFQVGGSCRVAAIRSQIENTLKQFSTVKSVIISINGRTEDILQP